MEAQLVSANSVDSDTFGEQFFRTRTQEDAWDLFGVQDLQESVSDLEESRVVKGAEQVNVVDHGAVADARVTATGSMTSGSAVLTTVTAIFNSSSVGKLVSVQGAGVAGIGLTGTVITYTSTTQVTLSVSASTTVASTITTVGTDNSDAFDDAIAAAANKGTIYVPNDVANGYAYSVSRTVNIGVGKTLKGSNLGGSIIYGATAGMTVVSYGSTSKIEDIQLDGVFVADIGALNTNTANKFTLHQVRAIRFIHTGLAFAGAQNATILDCSANNTIGHNWGIYNGCASMKFFNCNGRVQSEGVTTTRTISISYINPASDSRFPAAAFGSGNRNLSFIGGIYENGPCDYHVEISGDIDGYIAFTEVEITGGSLGNIHYAADVGSNRNLYLTRCLHHLSGNAGAKIVVAEYGGIYYSGLTLAGIPTGDSIRTLFTITGVATLTNLDRNVVEPRSSRFLSHAGGWTAQSTGTATWNATTRRVDIVAGSTSTGTKLTLPNSSNFLQYDMVLCKFVIKSLSGAATMRFHTTNSGGRVSQGDYADGYHEVLIEMVGNEIGFAFTASSVAAITFSLCSFTAELL
jgi:hypothetical protein